MIFGWMKLDCPEMIGREVLKIKAKKLNLFLL